MAVASASANAVVPHAALALAVAVAETASWQVVGHCEHKEPGRRSAGSTQSRTQSFPV